MPKKPKLLLHTCCGTCGCLVPELLSKDHEVGLYFVNPNIHPPKEYFRRYQDAVKVARLQEVEIIEGEYDTGAWFDAIRGHEMDKEGAERCALCFEFRLRKTAAYAKKHGYDVWTTVLTIGRNKKADVINSIGEQLAKEYGVPFLSRNFKKDGGLDRSIERSDEIGLGRQDYCGCVYSKKESEERRRAKA